MIAKSQYTIASISTILLIIGITFLMVQSGTFNVKKTATAIIKECSKTLTTDQEDCFQKNVLAIVKREPLQGGDLIDELWTLSKNGTFTGDPRIFSPIAHDVGMAMIDSQIALNNTIQSCGQAFKDGCIHGAVMEYVEKSYPKSQKNQFIGICNKMYSNNEIQEWQYANCIHGIGHILEARTTTSLPTTIELCNYFPNAYRGACASGVFMQASEGSANDDELMPGMNMDAVVGTANFDCSSISTDYQPICYSSAGSYRQYEANSESWQDSFTFCLQVPTLFQNDCMAGLDERLLISTADNQQKALEVCGSLSQALIPKCNGLLTENYQDF